MMTSLDAPPQAFSELPQRQDSGMRLTIIEHAGAPVRQRASALFCAPGATIGRGADNHLVLPDDTRQISRLQASLRIDDSGAYLSNLSTVCAVLVNEQPIAGDRPHRLQDGDIVTIGLYRLAAGEIEEAAAPMAAAAPPAGPDAADLAGLLAAQPSSQLPSQPHDPLRDPAPASAPDAGAGFMDLFAEPAAPAPNAAPLAAPYAEPPAASYAEPPTAPPVAPPASAAAPAAPAASLPHETFWDALTSEFAPSPAVATRFEPLDEGRRHTLLDMPADPAPAPDTDDVLASLGNASLDPLALFGGAPDDGASALFDDGASILPAESSVLADLRERQDALPPPVPSPLFDAAPPSRSPTDDFADLFRPSPVLDEPVPMAVPAPPRTSAPASPGDNRLAQAFLEGAGVNLADSALTEDQFRQAGRLLNKLIGGSMDLLASRTIIKREVRADLTMLLDKENNPLKLLPDAAMVLKQMFGPPLPGFMAPERAVDDSFHDLFAHQMGMLAGMRAALNQLLHNFSPEVVDKQMGADVWYERLMPKGRDGRAWARYRALHAAAVAAVEDDFHTVFGQAFLAAYDAEVELYRSQRQGRAC